MHCTTGHNSSHQYRIYGLEANGEKGHGIISNMMNRATEYQVAIVLNLELSVVRRLVYADPMVIIITASNIMELCSMQKNRIPRLCLASL